MAMVLSGIKWDAFLKLLQDCDWRWWLAALGVSVLVQAAAATEPNGATSISFSCPGNTSFNRTVRGVDPGELVNKLSDALFREEIRNGSNS